MRNKKKKTLEAVLLIFISRLLKLFPQGAYSHVPRKSAERMGFKPSLLKLRLFSRVPYIKGEKTEPL